MFQLVIWSQNLNMGGSKPGAVIPVLPVFLATLTLDTLYEDTDDLSDRFIPHSDLSNTFADRVVVY